MEVSCVVLVPDGSFAEAKVVLKPATARGKKVDVAKCLDAALLAGLDVAITRPKKLYHIGCAPAFQSADDDEPCGYLHFFADKDGDDINAHDTQCFFDDSAQPACGPVFVLQSASNNASDGARYVHLTSDQYQEFAAIYQQDDDDESSSDGAASQVSEESALDDAEPGLEPPLQDDDAPAVVARLPALKPPRAKRSAAAKAPQHMTLLHEAFLDGEPLNDLREWALGLIGTPDQAELERGCLARCIIDARRAGVTPAWSEPQFVEHYRLRVRRLKQSLEKIAQAGIPASEAAFATPEAIDPERWAAVILRNKRHAAGTNEADWKNLRKEMCPSCKELRPIGTLPLQLRSGDEGMTIFSQCMACGSRWEQES